MVYNCRGVSYNEHRGSSKGGSGAAHLVGWLDDEGTKSRAICTAERLMRQLPADRQREIPEIVKSMHRLCQEQQTEQTGAAE